MMMTKTNCVSKNCSLFFSKCKERKKILTRLYFSVFVGTCIISLMQKGRRALRDEGLDTLTIGFAIYHLKDPENTPKPLDTEFIKYNRSCARSKVFINLREVSRRFR